MKFGNAPNRGKSSSQSPLLGERGFQLLNTIEEEKNETQTSQYMESVSERENSKLYGSSNMRNSSNIVGLEFDEEFKPKSLSRKNGSSASHVISEPDIDKVVKSVDMELDNERGDNIGRLTGRDNSAKENLISQSMKEHTIN